MPSWLLAVLRPKTIYEDRKILGIKKSLAEMSSLPVGSDRYGQVFDRGLFVAVEV